MAFGYIYIISYNTPRLLKLTPCLLLALVLLAKDIWAFAIAPACPHYLCSVPVSLRHVNLFCTKCTAAANVIQMWSAQIEEHGALLAALDDVRRVEFQQNFLLELQAHREAETILQIIDGDEAMAEN